MSIKPSESPHYDSYEYVIDEYHVDIKVNENNTLDITENITVNFNVKRHGIIRILPLKNKLKRTNGVITNNKVQVGKIKVNEPYTFYLNSSSNSSESDELYIRIGNSNRTIIGKKNTLYNINTILVKIR